MTRTRPPPTRTGTTTKYRVGPCTLYVTVNGAPPLEVFAKADEGHQAEADGLAEMASLALQYGAPPAVVAAHMRHRRYPPHGGPGQPCSISDAVGQAIEDANWRGGETVNYRWDIELMLEEPTPDNYQENVAFVGTEQEAHARGQALADSCPYSVEKIVLHRCGEVSANARLDRQEERDASRV